MLGLELGFTVSALTDGAFVDEFFLDDDKIDIYLYSNLGTEARLEDMKTLPVHASRLGRSPFLDRQHQGDG